MTQSDQKSINLPEELGALVDDALAKVGDLGTVGAMKWLTKAVSDKAAADQKHVEGRTVELPDGYDAILVPEGFAPPAPDYDKCARQADLVTGIQCKDRSWLSIFIREINRWCAHRQAQTNEAMKATVKHSFRNEICETGVDKGNIVKRCRFCGTWEGAANANSPCEAVSLQIRAARATEPKPDFDKKKDQGKPNN